MMFDEIQIGENQAGHMCKICVFFLGEASLVTSFWWS